MRPVAPLLLALAGCRGPREVTVAPAPEPILVPAGGMSRYELSFPKASGHLVAVEATLPTDGRPELELMMASWTPGSYLVRDYARNVQSLTSPTGEVRKVGKNRWVVATQGADAVVVAYELYARDLSVRGNFVDRDLGLLNGAATFVVRADALDRPVEVSLELPPTWPDVATALDPVDGRRLTWRARSYDELVDSPLVAGDLARRSFEVSGVPHELVTWGEAGVWDGEKAARDVQTLTEEQVAFWGVVPYDRYLFLNVLAESGGGLEHARSTLMLASRWKTHDDDAYKKWLGLVSHELFHAWNVKRLRPAELGPFDYEQEVLTENLWIAEGFTAYYDDVLLARAGLIDDAAWVGRMAENVRSLQGTPGRRVHPLSEASRDAWIKHYKPDENSGNSSISYYTKGAVVAWLLDAEIRRATADTASLDDVMREALARYGGERGYTTAEFRALASEVAHTDLEPWFAHAVDGTGELDYGPALAWFGLRFAAITPPATSEGWAGAVFSGDRVSEVPTDTPAWSAGINVDDEVLAVNGFRVSGSGFAAALARHPPGATVEVLVSRRGALLTLPIVLGQAPDKAHELEIDPEARPQATTHRERLLASDRR